ncbi:hypothetical protein BK744_14320 [Bacillus thuringiensis serovar zhaodongensis]|nr:hypothetical protein BK744_14320 [Bacillus thuringiensis serovar zhaodongensis]
MVETYREQDGRKNQTSLCIVGAQSVKNGSGGEIIVLIYRKIQYSQYMTFIWESTENRIVEHEAYEKLPDLLYQSGSKR